MGLFGDDVEICPSGGDVELCLERDIELCTECPELTLTGTDEPIVGSEYTANGGSGDLTFSFDSGTISSAGIITAIDICGASGEDRTGVVGVTDSCAPTAQTAEITVRLPGGEWSSPAWHTVNGGCNSDNWDAYGYLEEEFCEGDGSYYQDWFFTYGKAQGEGTNVSGIMCPLPELDLVNYDYCYSGYYEKTWVCI